MQKRTDNVFLQVLQLAGIFAVVFCLLDVCFNCLIEKSFLGYGLLPLKIKAALIAADVCAFYIIFTFAFLPLLLQRWGSILTSLVMSGIVVLYLTSWMSMFLTKDFLNIEALRFFVFNFKAVLAHLLQSSAMVLGLMILVLFILPMVLLVVCFKYASLWFNLLGRFSGQCRLMALAGLIIIVPLIGLNQQDRLAFFTYEISPAITMLADLKLFGQNRKIVISTKDVDIHWEQQISLDAFLKGKELNSIGHVPVILVVIESLNNDVLKDASVMPRLYQFKQEGVSFENNYTSANESDYAWPAIFSSQYPLRSNDHHYYPEPITYPRVQIYDLLKKYNYATAIFSAQNEAWGGMSNFLKSDHLDLYFDATSSASDLYLSKEDVGFLKWASSFKNAGKLDDAVVMAKAVQWMKTHSTGNFFAALNFQRSHFPYTWPQGYQPAFVPFEMDFNAIYASYPEEKAALMKNRYLNSLSYVDLQIGQLIDFLKEHHLYEKSLIVMTGDHGEAFYEKKAVSCHGSTLYNETARTPLIIKKPFQRQGEKRLANVQGIDIPPTICDVLNIPIHPSFQGRSVFDPSYPADRPILMTVQTPRANQDAVVLGKWKLIKSYETYMEIFHRLYDLKDDPDELRDLADDNKRQAAYLDEMVSSWRQIQIDYYQDKMKQEKFYAPKIIFKDNN